MPHNGQAWSTDRPQTMLRLLWSIPPVEGQARLRNRRSALSENSRPYSDPCKRPIGGQGSGRPQRGSS
eukprot:7338097-Pyramimonas_sp.AAC.1